eukprot:1161909-Pelagomonas_calceolata.AAC.6
MYVCVSHTPLFAQCLCSPALLAGDHPSGNMIHHLLDVSLLSERITQQTTQPCNSCYHAEDAQQAWHGCLEWDVMKTKTRTHLAP